MRVSKITFDIAQQRIKEKYPHYKDLYNETINREKELKSLGYNIIYIWESKFDGTTGCTK